MDGLLDGCVGGLLAGCVGVALFVTAVAVADGFVAELLVVVEDGFVIAGFGGCCFFGIGMGEMTKLFLRLLRCSLFDFDPLGLTLFFCIGISCFGFGFAILTCCLGLARGEIVSSSIGLASSSIVAVSASAT